jgi:hypothetical protein
MTFLACTGFIVWAHSRDTRILGVQPQPSISTSAAADQAAVTRQGPQYIKEEYVKELVSAASLPVVDNARSSYLVSLIHHKRYLSHKADSLLLRFRPQQVLHQ